jgi:asparagine synthase (glutamine-hydrolysing)
LRIRDLSAARDQPIYNETKSKCVVFAGEIYNRSELRNQLKSREHKFTTESDAEIILRLYEEFGADCVNHLKGMFAFAVRDDRKLIIARDRTGIKPLYYTYLKERGLFLFASEIKSLLQSEIVPAVVDKQALTDRRVLGYVPGNRTYFEGVKSLSPGHYLSVEIGDNALKLAEKQYYRVTVDYDDSLASADITRNLARLLLGSVQEQLRADAPIGLCLSGGLDSSCLALAAKLHCGLSIPSFSVADNDTNPDFIYAAKVAERTGSNHTQVIIEWTDYLNSIPDYIWAVEIPSRYGMPFFMLCDVMSKSFRCCLNGVGADTLFAGDEYADRLLALSVWQANLSRAKATGLQPSVEVLALLDKLFHAGEHPTEQARVFFAIDIQEQLVKMELEPTDKLAMAHGIEMRLPYLSEDLVDYASRIPVSLKLDASKTIRKYAFKQAALSLFGHSILDIANRRKQGLPKSGESLMLKFKALCEANLSDEYVGKHEYKLFFPSKMELIIFDLFHSIFVDGKGKQPDDLNLLDFVREKSGRTTLSI